KSPKRTTWPNEIRTWIALDTGATVGIWASPVLALFLARPRESRYTRRPMIGPTGKYSTMRPSPSGEPVCPPLVDQAAGRVPQLGQGFPHHLCRALPGAEWRRIGAGLGETGGEHRQQLGALALQLAPSRLRRQLEHEERIGQMPPQMVLAVRARCRHQRTPEPKLRWRSSAEPGNSSFSRRLISRSAGSSPRSAALRPFSNSFCA